MHIALGAFLLSGVPGYRQAGIHHYIKHLLHALPEVAPADMTFSAFISPTASDEIDDDLRDAMDVIPADTSTEGPFARILCEQMDVPGMLRDSGADAYHGLAFALPLASRLPALVTVYDLSFITQPKAHKLANRLYLNQMTRLACRRARRVIAISEYTRRDTAKYLSISLDRVDAIPLGVQPRFAPPEHARRDAFRRDKGIGPGSIFFLGSIEPRKNLNRLLDAFVTLRTHEPQLPLELLIGGSLGWKYDETLARVKRLGLDDRVKFIGRVPDDELPLWYSACDVFAYPSLYEGFGLPVLEAMACGAVVVTSNSTSLPEVAGDACLLADPENVPEIAAMLHSALTDAPLRATLRERGIARAREFTWQRTARMTIESYRRVCG